jgi:hypothetical protein
VSILGRPGGGVKRAPAVAVARAGAYTEFLRFPGVGREGIPMGFTAAVLAVIALGLVGAWLVRLARSGDPSTPRGTDA